ncbi:LAETG motif-containing sortase-dependent surface protein [uncultured Streptomyces sp.]|uniref:LAETG motif-containing sortase-dependent surface protein n=1 Tax=uncultured Streptomyces sp. TaxID=174707 RepID=UPI00260906CF|nr:LAETG motif-containing sortase-dependent surface protein [uncultured Streptomyces sp.]
MRLTPRTAIAALAVGTVLSVIGMPGVALADDAVHGEKRVLVAVVGFNDATFPDENLVMKNVEQSYFGADNSLAGYYKKMSQGQFTFVPAAESKAVGPYHLDLSQNPCNADAVHQQTVKALEADGYVKDEDYDSLSIIEPAEGGECAWAGLGSVPGPNTWMNLGGDEASEALLVHEFGHNMGYGHHARDYCPEGDLSRCAEDGTSHKTPMGSGGSIVGLVAPELIHSGWLGGGQARTVDTSGTYDLVSLHGEQSGTRALDIPMGDDRLVIEYRHEVNFSTKEGKLDSTLEGVHAYRVEDGNYATSIFLDPTAEAGEGADDAISTLTDKEHGIEVKVVTSGGGSATVAVSLNGKPAPADAAPATADPAAEGPSPQGEQADGAPISEAGTDASSGETPGPRSTPDLAATGGSPVTPYLTAGGIGFLVLGSAAVLGFRRRTRGRRHAA